MGKRERQAVAMHTAPYQLGAAGTGLRGDFELDRNKGVCRTQGSLSTGSKRPEVRVKKTLLVFSFCKKNQASYLCINFMCKVDIKTNVIKLRCLITEPAGSRRM